MYCNVCMYVCMYVSLHFPFAPQYFPQKKHSVFAKRTSKNFQIFGKRVQEAQASKKAGRGNRAWDPCFATPAPRRLRLVERHQIAARYVGDPPPQKKNLRNRRRAGGLDLPKTLPPFRHRPATQTYYINFHRYFSKYKIL